MNSLRASADTRRRTNDLIRALRLYQDMRHYESTLRGMVAVLEEQGQDASEHAPLLERAKEELEILKRRLSVAMDAYWNGSAANAEG